MRHKGLLQAELVGTLAALGHTDTLVIADAGLPIPDGPQKFDLAVCPGLPSFMQLCTIITPEMPVEAVTIATEMRDKNPDLYQQLQEEIAHWGTRQGKTLQINEIPHENLKQEAAKARAIVRTGEFSPFANIIIHAGVAF